MKNQTDVYEKITASIIEAIEAGCGKFEMPWHTFGASRPMRATNAGTVESTSSFCGPPQASAATRPSFGPLTSNGENWARKCGKERNPPPLCFGSSTARTARPIAIAPREKTEDSRKRCFARAYHVFNADQVEGFSIPEMPVLPEAQRIPKAEDFFRHTGVRIVETGMRAYYDSKADEIHMPPFSVFKKADYFYSTLAHEMIHATGHASRCNRQLGNRFGSEMYAAEELVAELGSAFLSAELQLETEPRVDNAPYIENWLRVLKSNNRAIFTAASKAQQAVDWLLNQKNQEQAA